MEQAYLEALLRPRGEALLPTHQSQQQLICSCQELALSIMYLPMTPVYAFLETTERAGTP